MAIEPPSYTTAVPPAFTYSNLLPELLLCLVGFPGDVFVDADTKDVSSTRDAKQSITAADTIPALSSTTLKVGNVIDWVDKPDRDLLEGLLKLGHHYICISRFTEAQQRLPHDKQSLYRRALATGLKEVFQVYRAAVMEVHQLIQSGSQVVLPSIQYFLSEFMLLLPALHQLVYEVTSEEPRKPNTGLLFTKLEQLAQSGVPVIRSCGQRLLWYCNEVLLNQLSMWMCYGQLLDPHGEFFIISAKQAAASKAQSQADVAGQQSAPSTVQSGSTTVQRPEHGGYNEWRSGYQVEDEKLPNHISQDLARSICFIGNAVRVLRQPAGNFKGKELLPHRDILEFEAALKQLRVQPTFNNMELERTVETVRSKVADKLWHLVVIQSDLAQHLTAIKDYFLMSKGDFWRCFLDESMRLMQRPVKLSAVEADVAIPFRQAALKSTAQHDPLFGLFKLRYTNPVSSAQQSASSSSSSQSAAAAPQFDEQWDPLSIEYQLQWPLTLLIGQSHLTRYNHLFQLLFRLKRVQLMLDGSWHELCGKGLRAETRRSTQMLKLLHMRAHMSHLIHNLQVYLQTDVIESNFTTLLEKIASAHDYTAAEAAHESFLATVMHQSFLTMKSISNLLAQMFAQIRTLCNVLEQAKPTGKIDFVKVGEVHDQFSRKICKEFYTMLTSVKLMQMHKDPHLRKLYMRLDYNGYISTKYTYRQDEQKVGMGR